MRITPLALALALVSGSATAFSTNANNNNNNVELSSTVVANANRRAVLSSIFTTVTAGSTLILSSPQSAYAGLLDEYGADPNTDKQPPTKKEKVQARDKGKPESNLEPNLRSNYYYPTNKVRYLPRIKKCSDAIPGVAVAIGNEDWDAVRNFATVVADDTVLPMKLYVSSLTGGGTNVKVGFAKNMMSAAKTFEKNQALLLKAVDKKDGGKSSAALEAMAEAMLEYRTEGRLLGPDGGGDIPSVDEIRRSTKRFRGEAFEAKIKERDARVASAQ
ncbi:hypothetical protein ACHAWC_004149 [Mediolabrus comicus]